MAIKMNTKTREKIIKMLWDEFFKEYSNRECKELQIKRSRVFGLTFTGQKMQLLLNTN